MRCIDVSSYQGTIDWKRVKPQIDVAILRCGYGDDIVSQDDQEFFNNVNGCIENGIPFGVYLYSYAKNLTGSESIQSEIEHCKRLLGQIDVLPFCIYLDMEDDSTRYLGRKGLSSFANFFCKNMTEAGYKAGIYANEYWFNHYLDVKRISGEGYSIWCAKYSLEKPNIGVSYDIWQYSSTGTLDGIRGFVDMNEMIKDITNVREEQQIPVNQQVNVFYRVKVRRDGWLPEVKNLEDFAGWKNRPITGIAIKVDKGSIKYRVHLKEKGWLSYVTGYDIQEIKNGYAGNGQSVIDAVEVYYYTPNEIRPFKKAKYRINDYSWQYDNEKKNGQDGYAGRLGISATKFQIVIE